MATSEYAVRRVLVSLLCTTAAPATVFSEDTKKEVSYRISSVVNNCTLSASDGEIVDTINGHLSSGFNLLKFSLQFSESENVFKNDNSSLMYKPLAWVRTPGRLGNGLLLLRPEYDVLSLQTLELGVVSMHIMVQATPPGCLGKLADRDIEKVLRALVLNHFENSSKDDTDNGRPRDQVCNLHTSNTSGVATFRYFCCRKNGPNHVHCTYLEKDTWLDILFSVMTFLKILVILFSPRFVPDSFYRIRDQAQTYRHKCLDGKNVTVKTVLTKKPNSRQLADKVNAKVPISKFKNMEVFRPFLDSLNEDQPYCFVMKEIRFSVSRGRLLSAESAPVGLFKTFYEAFIKCQISERDALQECCNADMLKKLPCQRSCSFYRFCKELMKVVLVLLLAVPWIIRVVAYYKFEHTEMIERKAAANYRGLEVDFPGNLTLLLTPLHGVFIVVYVILSLEVCICGAAGGLGRKVSETLRFVTRKCFRDMRETDNTDIVGWAVKLSLKPCSSLGLFGILIGLLLWPIILPLILIVWAFYMFPTINITFRLLGDLIFYLLSCTRKTRNEPNTAPNHVRNNRRDKIYGKLHLEQLRAPESSSKESKKVEKTISRWVQPFIIIISLISLYSIIFLFVELVSFVVEIVVYTMMGLILNAGTIMTYISLCLLLGLYGNECFGYVTKTFMAFNKKMNQIVLGLAIEKVENVIYTRNDKQENCSFRVKTGRCETLDRPVQFTTNLEGRPSWSVGRLLLFLDKMDQPLIPSKFYFKACKMDYYAAPGELLFRYISAAVEFGAILLFLIFVLLVVMAFGDSFEISSTNKLFATTLGGFVPLLLRKVVFKAHAVPDIDQSSVHFQVSLTDLIEPYQELWPIVDIDVDTADVLEDYDGPIDLLIDCS